jgi:hypothetical protein
LVWRGFAGARLLAKREAFACTASNGRSNANDEGEVEINMFKTRKGAMRLKSFLFGSVCLCTSVLGASILTPALAQAQSSPDTADKLDRMQRLLEQQQEQIKALKGEMAQAKKRAATTDDPQAAYAADVAVKPAKLVKAPPPPAVKMTWGGFLAAETVYRQHNAVSDMGTTFTSIPYPFSPLYDEHEFHGDARQSRLSLLVEGSIDPTQKLAGYYEMDFNGVGVTSNFNQSNSWAPRLRHAYFTYDNSDSGFHLLAGQAWSLVTQNTAGIVARKENIPLTIEANYVAGFDFTRNWQIRLVKDWGPTVSAAVSLENPAEQVFAGTQVFANGAVAAATGNGAIGNGGTFNGLIVNWANAGNGFLGSGGFANNFNTETAPDVIGKLAFDPGWGHYEVLGMVRFFTDNVFTCTVVLANGACPLTVANVGSAGSKITVGEGVGGSVLLPVVPKFLDLQASALYGKGIGRYGANQLADVVVASDGTLSPVTALHVMAGAVAHPWAGLDIYAYGGFERADPNLFTTTTGVITGFGSPIVNNTGCGIITAASFTGGTSNCQAVNKEVDMATVGFWQNIYKGNYGRVAAGLQYEYIVRKSFDTNPGLGGPVSTNDNVVMTSLRYYPF